MLCNSPSRRLLSFSAFEIQAHAEAAAITKAPVGEEHEQKVISVHQAQARAQNHSEFEVRQTHNLPCRLYVQASHQLSPPILSTLTLTTRNLTRTHIIPLKHGHVFFVKAHQYSRIIDLHGAQVVDLMAWTRTITFSNQQNSVSYTRYKIGGSAPPQIGEELLKLTTYTVKTHDLLCMACNPSFYAEMGLQGHASCAENISGAITKSGPGKMGWNDIVDPFNVFRNTPYDILKALRCSKAGHCVEVENVLEKDIVIALL